MARYGEYSTRRLVLDAWERLEAKSPWSGCLQHMQNCLQEVSLLARYFRRSPKDWVRRTWNSFSPPSPSSLYTTFSVQGNAIEPRRALHRHFFVKSRARHRLQPPVTPRSHQATK